MVSPQGRLFRRLKHDETVHVLGASDVPRARPTSETWAAAKSMRPKSQPFRRHRSNRKLAGTTAMRRQVELASGYELCLFLERLEITAHRTSTDPGLEQFA